jgi:hypothetical protein
MSAPDELLPCPFCGGESEMVDAGFLCVGCKDATCPGYNAEASAEKWNKRASPAPQAGVPMEALLEWIDRDMTYFDVDRSQPTNGPNVPVLAAVSKRIWYHATDSDAYPFSAVAKTTLGTARDAAPSADAGVREALHPDVLVFLRRVVRTIDQWDGPMEHPFAKLVTPNVRAALSPAAQQPTETP